jgi:hypothetical protein
MISEPTPTRGPPDSSGNPPAADRVPWWGLIARELDDLGLTKAEFRIFCHILRRAGSGSVCNAGVRSMARVTRTHPVYVRWIVRHLLKRKLILRTIRPGHTNVLEPAPKYEWLARYGTDADLPAKPYEETADEAALHVLWSRVWTVMPGAHKAPFEKRMKADRHLFERVLAEVEDRARRGQSKGADQLLALKDPVAYFNYTWDQFRKANPKKK